MSKKDKEMELHLVQKGKWYDMVESGEKPEEYRNFTPYWKKRLDPLVFKRFRSDPQVFEKDYVVFHRGYTLRTMKFVIAAVRLGIGKKEWGFEGEDLKYIIELGERIF